MKAAQIESSWEMHKSKNKCLVTVKIFSKKKTKQVESMH